MEVFNKIVSLLGGRKAFITLFVFIVSTILLVLNRVEESNYLTILKTLFLAYTATNVLQHQLVTTSSKNVKSETPRPVGRKFIISLIIFIIVSILTGLTILSDESFGSIVVWIVGLYSAGNVGAKLKPEK
jgi:hypothetical protein